MKLIINGKQFSEGYAAFFKERNWTISEGQSYLALKRPNSFGAVIEEVLVFDDDKRDAFLGDKKNANRVPEKGEYARYVTDQEYSAVLAALRHDLKWFGDLVKIEEGVKYYKKGETA